MSEFILVDLRGRQSADILSDAINDYMAKIGVRKRG
jgi:hypothetical protein